MRKIISKIIVELDLDLLDSEIAASAKSKKGSKHNRNSRNDIQDSTRLVLDNLFYNVSNILINNGFVPLFKGSSNPDSEHLTQDDISYYKTYEYGNSTEVKILLEVRVSNHGAKPNIETRNVKRMEDLNKLITKLKSGNASPAILDIYCKQVSENFRLFIGSGSDKSYSEIKRVQDLDAVLSGKLKKFISRVS